MTVDKINKMYTLLRVAVRNHRLITLLGVLLIYEDTFRCMTFRCYLWGSALQRSGENVLRQPFPGLFDTLNNWSCTANYNHDVAYLEKITREQGT